MDSTLTSLAMSYSAIDASLIMASLEHLSRRIAERFPESGLLQVNEQLLTFSRNAQDDAVWVAKPIVSLRAATGLLVLLIVLGTVWSLRVIGMPDETPPLAEFVTLLEAAINDIVLIGAGIFFLLTAETRLKRRRALKSLHQLRAFAHVIDMHQLLKDPERVLRRGEQTPSTPAIGLSSFELTRYLEYCSELLSLTGKTAGLYAQSSSDSVVVDAVSEIEQFTNGISQKVWQKLMILHLLEMRSS